MISAIMGHNRFENCRTLIAWQERPLLQVKGEPSSLRLDTTGLGDKIRGIRIEGKGVTAGEGVRVVISEFSTTVFVNNEGILFVTKLDQQTLHAKVDLRSLGLNVYDDVEGLHVGRNIIIHNAFRDCEVGVRLA